MYRSKTERCWICVTVFIETRKELKQLSLGGMCFFLEGITFEDLCSKSPPFKERSRNNLDHFFYACHSLWRRTNARNVSFLKFLTVANLFYQLITLDYPFHIKQQGLTQRKRTGEHHWLLNKPSLLLFTTRASSQTELCLWTVRRWIGPPASGRYLSFSIHTKVQSRILVVCLACKLSRTDGYGI